jgi:cytochrome c553
MSDAGPLQGANCTEARSAKVPQMTRACSRWALAALALTFVAAPTVAADLDAAKKKVTEICQACHGMDGNSPLPENPKLAGQNPDYLAKALRDYKSGARKNPVMASMATGLTTQDIDNLAAYFGSQPTVLQARY